MLNASDVSVSGGFHVDGSRGRDGLDLVNCQDVLVEDARIEGSDDALCFKTITNNGLGQSRARTSTALHTGPPPSICSTTLMGC